MPQTAYVVSAADLQSANAYRFNSIFSSLNGRISQLKALQATLQDTLTTLTTTVAALGHPLTNPMTTLGDLIYENASLVPARLAGNISTTEKVLSSTGTGSAANAPLWVDPTILSNSYVLLSSLSNTSSLGITDIQRTSGFALNASNYLVTVILAGTSVNAVTLSGVLAWTDPKGGAQIASLPSFVLASTGSAAVQLVTGVRTDGSANLTVAVSKSGAGTINFDVIASVIQL